MENACWYPPWQAQAWPRLPLEAQLSHPRWCCPYGAAEHNADMPRKCPHVRDGKRSPVLIRGEEQQQEGWQ